MVSRQEYLQVHDCNGSHRNKKDTQIATKKSLCRSLQPSSPHSLDPEITTET